MTYFTHSDDSKKNRQNSPLDYALSIIELINEEEMMRMPRLPHPDTIDQLKDRLNIDEVDALEIYLNIYDVLKEQPADKPND